MVRISESNRKIGKTASISLSSYYSCDHSLQCYKKKCYAKRMENRINILRAWTQNSYLYMTNPTTFKNGIENFLDKKKTLFFRWHVGGDIPDRRYYDIIFKIASNFRETKFLLFTKRYNLMEDIIYSLKFIPNLNVKLSMWPYEKQEIEYNSLEALNKVRNSKLHNISATWINTDVRRFTMRNLSRKCLGSCEHCRLCWYTDNDIVFNLH